MNKKLKEQSKPTKDIETEWRNIKKCINETAEVHVGIKRNKKRQEWYNEECHNMLKKKVEMRQMWIRTNRQDYREEYNIIRHACKKKIRKIRREWLDDKIKEIEKESKNRNTKEFYKKISEQNKTFKGKIKSIKDKNGKVSENDEEYKEIWTKFKGKIK
uniref:Uncharacterized protein LOC114347444 n=1 Tax=Diabrotica virgifera virgifera TaxID=50390 RepID=A0A6P7H8C1_DIAVI